MTADELIAEGEQLKKTPFDDPDQDLWDNDVREFVKPYGTATYEVLGRTLESGIIPSSDYECQQQRVECITKTQKLLKRLAERSTDRQLAQSEVIAPNFEQAKKQVQGKVSNNTTYNFHAPATFGDNSPITQITIGEFMAGLEREVQEKVADPTEKNRLLDTIRSITSDPSFKAVATTAATEVVKKLIGG